jgi:DNA polymerase III delta prime subunit
VVGLLTGIAQNEGLELDPVTAEKIATMANGDIRQMINSLQMWRVSCKHLQGNDVQK